LCVVEFGKLGGIFFTKDRQQNADSLFISCIWILFLVSLERFSKLILQDEFSQLFHQKRGKIISDSKSCQNFCSAKNNWGIALALPNDEKNAERNSDRTSYKQLDAAEVMASSYFGITNLTIGYPLDRNRDRTFAATFEISVSRECCQYLLAGGCNWHIPGVTAHYQYFPG